MFIPPTSRFSVASHLETSGGARASPGLDLALLVLGSGQVRVRGTVQWRGVDLSGLEQSRLQSAFARGQRHLA